MAILVDKNSKVMIQGITGGAGKFHTARMISYGTNIVGGTSPGKGGQEIEGKPVFDTVAEPLRALDLGDKSEVSRRVFDTLELTGLKSSIGRDPSENPSYSGGDEDFEDDDDF